MSPEVKKVIGGEMVSVFYNGETFTVPKLLDEDQVRQVMSEQFPDVANAQLEQDEQGNWTITREAGSKGL
jgi:PRTRC genetic system protein C